MMSKIKLIFTGYEEEWESTTVTIKIKATFNGMPCMVTSLPLSHKRASSEVIRRTAITTMQDVVEDAIFRIGMRASDYNRDLKDMLGQFQVFLHQDFREQCEEHEIPFNHLLNA